MEIIPLLRSWANIGNIVLQTFRSYGANFKTMKKLLIPCVLLTCVGSAYANVRLPDVIGSSMVLQQKQRVPIWGTADPGEAITVSLGKQKKTAVADAGGKWRVDLSPMSANSAPRSSSPCKHRAPAGFGHSASILLQFERDDRICTRK